MPRGTKRTWIKLFCYERLHGSVAFQLTPAERSVWDELLCLAGLCGLEGLIADRDSRPFPHSYIAHECHISLELLETTLAKCIEEGRITENEHGIYLTNWSKYQSEYDRQKPYRQQQAAAASKTPLSKKALNELRAERQRLGRCELCGEEGHTKYECPSSHFQHLVKR